MKIEQYELLTGKVISGDQRTAFQAQINRVQSMLEALLGYTLEPSNIYTELGKTRQSCDCSNIPKTSDLLPADPIKGRVKLFPYNQKDRYLHIDPFHQLYSVKLVKIAENRQFITCHTFESISPEYMTPGIAKYVENCSSCGCSGLKPSDKCVQLAVDADWVDFTDDDTLIPKDLLYLLCDMVDFYANPYKDIKSESVDGHSWSKGAILAPQQAKEAIMLIKRYAGPFGSINQTPTV